VSYIKDVGEKVAKKHGVDAEYLMGFSRPPLNSAFQLHMHVISKPLTCGAVKGYILEHWLVTPNQLTKELKARK